MNFLYYSNQNEILTRKLAELIAEQKISPFQKELILIEAAGMQHYLSLALAEQNGICSGIKFCFPTRFLKELLGLKLRAPFPFDPKQTAWLIWKVLSSSEAKQNSLASFLQESFYERQKDPKQDPIQNPKQNFIQDAISDSASDSMHSLIRYHFACNLAHLFDRYLLHNPEWATRYEEGQKELENSRSQNVKESKDTQEAWQVHIWKLLCRRYPELDLKAQIESFFAMQSETRLREAGNSVLPNRIFVFCISLLPPLVEKTLLRIASSHSIKLDVHWFFLEPGPEALSLKKGSINPLWKYYNKFRERLPTRIYSQIQAHSKQAKKSPQQISELCQELQGISLLKDIQKALYHNRNILHSQKEKEKKPLPLLIDDSLCIQNCHSPLREVEVLHDWLIEQFQKNPNLAPEDILVLSPDPELYAPFIEAIFSNANQEDELPALPFNLRDTSQEDFSFVSIFFKLMDLGSMRFEATDIFAIVSNPYLAKQAGFSLEDLELIREYIMAAGICWGRDGKHRMQYNLRAEDRHTFKEGFLRLFLSYALPPDSAYSFQSSAAALSTLGLAPVLDLEGENAILLGDFAELLESLAHYAQKLRGLYTLSEWVQILSEMEEELLGSSKMKDILEGLHVAQREGAFNQPVEFAPVRAYLEQCQNELAEKRSFLSPQSGIQFAGLSSMRAVPYPLICLLGMNENDFPRREQNYEFDLLASHTQRPPSQSHRDRLLFLELLLCVGSQLYISYVGQSQYRPKENFAPSVLISELGSYIDRVYASEQGSPPFAKLIQKHSIQGFSQVYFSSATSNKSKKNKLFSYAKQNCKAAQALHKAEIQGTKDLPFWDDFSTRERDQNQTQKAQRTEREESEQSREIKLRALLDFFKDPAKSWTKQNLELSLAHPSKSEMLPEEEPLSLDSLENYKLCMYLVKAMLQHGEKTASIMPEMELKAQIHLPHGNYGKLSKDRLWEEAILFHESIKKHSNSSIIKALKQDFSLTIDLNRAQGSLILSGQFEAFCNEEGDLIFFNYAKHKGAISLSAWIVYLTWNLYSYNKSKVQRDKRAYLVCKDKYLEYDLSKSFCAESEVKAKKEKTEVLARSYLGELCKLYLDGLEKPLCYFNESSWAYASNISAKNDTIQKDSESPSNALNKALGAAQRKWYGDGFYNMGEKQGLYTSLCFRQRDPFQERVLSKEFQDLSLRIWEPILRHSKAFNIKSS